MQELRDPTHRQFGTPLSVWLKHFENELPIDAVGIWQIVPVLKNDFALQGNELVQAVRSAIRNLLAAGAIPVEGIDSNRWRAREDLAAPGELGVNLVVQYWQQLDHEPHVGDIWFALPSDVA